MTKQSIKAYIDRILGNNIRLLLPSYWWKRAFGTVVDHMVTEDGIKTINGESVIGEGDLRVGVKNVASVEELESLSAELGDLATVAKGGYTTGSFRDCYHWTEDDWETIAGVHQLKEEAYSKGTKVSKVEVSVPTATWDKDMYLVFLNKERSSLVAIIFSTDDGKRILWEKADTHNGDMEENGILWSEGDSQINQTDLDRLNNILANENCFYCLEGDVPDYNIIETCVRPMFLSPYIIDAYIKGETWKRLLKEGDVTGGGTADRILYVNIQVNNMEGNVSGELTKEQLAYNKETFKLVTECKASVLLQYKILGVPITSYATHVYVVDGETLRLVFDTNLENAIVCSVGVMLHSDGNTEAEVWQDIDNRPYTAVFYVADNTRGYTLTDEEKENNITAYSRSYTAYRTDTPLHMLVRVRGDITTYEPVSFFLPSMANQSPATCIIKGAGSEECVVTINFDGSATYLERNGIDSTLSATSTNPVQNKVVTEALNAKADKTYVDNTVANITVDSELSKTSTNPVQNKVVTDALSKTQKAVRVFVNPNELETLIQEALANQYHSIDIDAERFEYVFGTFMKDNYYDLYYMDIALVEDQNEIPYWSLTERWTDNTQIGIEFTKRKLNIYTRDYTYTSIYIFYNPLNPDDYTIEAERWVIPESELRGSYTAYVDNAIANVTIAVDSELSETSENPVQNKVVYGLAVTVDEHTAQLETYLNYTTQSITRIDGQIATKQDTISDLATIRSNATLGSTAIQEHQDISHLATKEELEILSEEVIKSEEVYAAALVDLNARIEALTKRLDELTNA